MKLAYDCCSCHDSDLGCLGEITNFCDILPEQNVIRCCDVLEPCQFENCCADFLCNAFCGTTIPSIGDSGPLGDNPPLYEDLVLKIDDVINIVPKVEKPEKKDVISYLNGEFPPEIVWWKQKKNCVTLIKIISV